MEWREEVFYQFVTSKRFINLKVARRDLENIIRTTFQRSIDFTTSIIVRNYAILIEVIRK